MLFESQRQVGRIKYLDASLGDKGSARLHRSKRRAYGRSTSSWVIQRPVDNSGELQCVAVCCSVVQCVAVCCSVYQCVAVCCSALQCVAVCLIQGVSYHQIQGRCAKEVVPLVTCWVLCWRFRKYLIQGRFMKGVVPLVTCNKLQHTSTHSCMCYTRPFRLLRWQTLPRYCLEDSLQHTWTHCNTLQHIAQHCNTLQRTATHSVATVLMIQVVGNLFREGSWKESSHMCHTWPFWRLG